MPWNGYIWTGVGYRVPAKTSTGLYHHFQISPFSLLLHPTPTPLLMGVKQRTQFNKLKTTSVLNFASICKNSTRKNWIKQSAIVSASNTKDFYWIVKTRVQYVEYTCSFFSEFTPAWYCVTYSKCWQISAKDPSAVETTSWSSIFELCWTEIGPTNS